jgi:hypothetical protein
LNSPPTVARIAERSFQSRTIIRLTLQDLIAWAGGRDRSGNEKILRSNLTTNIRGPNHSLDNPYDSTTIKPNELYEQLENI